MNDSIQAPRGELMSSWAPYRRNSPPLTSRYTTTNPHLVSRLPLISSCGGVGLGGSCEPCESHESCVYCEPPSHKGMFLGVILWESLVGHHSSFVYIWRSSCPIQRKQLCIGSSVIWKGSSWSVWPSSQGNHPDFHTYRLFLPFRNFLETASYSGWTWGFNFGPLCQWG